MMLFLIVSQLLLTGSIFLVELYLGFHMGFVGTHNMRKRVIMNGKAVAWYYIWHDTFLVDLISAAALIGQVRSLCVPSAV